MLVYPCGLDVSSSALRFLSSRLREHRRGLGTRWRRLSAGRQALLALAHLRNGHPYVQLAAGTSTAGQTRVTRAPEARSVFPTAAGGRRSLQGSRPSIDPTRRSGRSSSKPSPPSSPGDSFAGSVARPPASRSSSRPSSVCIRPAQLEDGKRSVSRVANSSASWDSA